MFVDKTADLFEDDGRLRPVQTVKDEEVIFTLQVDGPHIDVADSLLQLLSYAVLLRDGPLLDDLTDFAVLPQPLNNRWIVYKRMVIKRNQQLIEYYHVLYESIAR